MYRLIPAGKHCLVRFNLTQTSVARLSSAVGHHDAHHHPIVFDRKNVYPRIGDREIVGYGRNGEPQYYDAPDSPLPSIRWRPDSAEIKALREKANGDWSKLSIDEKKKRKHSYPSFFFFLVTKRSTHPLKKLTFLKLRMVD